MFSSSPTIQCPSCAPMGSNSLSPGTCKWAKAPFVEGTQDDYGRSRQGYIVRVFDDMVVFECHEFGKGGKIGADWIMPLGKYDPHPFVRTELLKVIGKPQFRPGAELKVESGAAQTVKLYIPPADGNPKCRVFAYDVAVETEKSSSSNGPTSSQQPSMCHASTLACLPSTYLESLTQYTRFRTALNVDVV